MEEKIMYVFIKILAVIMIILFIPIPFSIRLRYIDEPEVYVYSFKLNLRRIQNIIKKRKAKKTDCDEEDKDKYSKLKYYKEIISNIGRLRFKPNLKLRLKSHYGLNDAAVTGISYGIISGALAACYEVLNKFFNIKEYDLSVRPEYNKLTFDCDIKCIIFINLAKIIYMVIIFLKSIKKSKEVTYSFT
jgi:hypothetical protein